MINVVTDILLYFLGEDALEAHNLECYNKQFLVVNSNVGGAYMLFYTFTILLYSVVMYYIFYKIPLKYNLVAWQRMGVKKLDMNQDFNSRQSMTTKGMEGNME